MSQASRLAVEVTRGIDNLDIWVDANNNGVRDDDDVNIYVTAGGGFYTVSPTFRHALDTAIQARIKELAVAVINKNKADASAEEEQLCELALELVVKAVGTPEDDIDIETAPIEQPPSPNVAH